MNWSKANLAEVPAINVAFGDFFISANDFAKYFSSISVGYYIDQYVNNYFDIVGRSTIDTSSKSYLLTFN